MAYRRETTAARIGGGVEVKGFPIILRENYAVDFIALEYCLELLMDASVGAVRTYAGHLVDFISQLEAELREEQEGLSDKTEPLEDTYLFERLDDDWLEDYKADILGRKNAEGKSNSNNYASQVLASVVRYLYWLEEENYLNGVVGTNRFNKVRIKKTNKGISHRLAKNKKSTRAGVTPREEWIEAISNFGPKREDLSVRFCRMLEWGKAVGLRSFEITSVTIDQLPLKETAEKDLATGRNSSIKLITTKGDKPATVPIPPQLVLDTWKYVHEYRTDIVGSFKKKARSQAVPYQAPPQIFLSNKTGQALTPKTFSNTVRSAFKKAVKAGLLTEDERVWAQGLRHNFVDTLLTKTEESGVRRPEAVTRKASRHGSDDAMQSYVGNNFLRNKQSG